MRQGVVARYVRRQAPGMRIVASLSCRALLDEFCGPRLIRQSTGQAERDVGGAGGQRDLFDAVVPVAHDWWARERVIAKPHAREVGFAVSGPRRRCLGVEST